MVFFDFLLVELKNPAFNIKKCLYDNEIINILLEQIKKEKENT